MGKKMKPSPIKTKKGYRLQFSYKGQQYKRFLIKNENVANVIQARINTLVTEFKAGLRPLPEDVSLPDFIFDSAAKKPETKTVPQAPVTRLSDLIREYEKTSAPPAKALSTWKTEKIHLRHLERFIAEQQSEYGIDPMLTDIDVKFFDLYKHFRYTQKIRTDTVNKEISTFQALLQMAVKYRYLKYNVVREVKRDKSQVPAERFRTHTEIKELLKNGDYSKDEIYELKRFRYLTPKEIKELIALAEGKWIHPILITCAHTGMRKGELIKLEWGDVDLERRFLWASSGKQSQIQKETKRRVPLDDTLLATLHEQKLKSGDSRWVFPGPNGGKMSIHTLGESLRRLLKGTDFEGLGFHAFRHSLCSNLASKGVDQRFIDKIVGHQTEAMRRRYQHLFPEPEIIDQIGY